MPTPVSEDDTVSPGSRTRERSRDRPLSASAQARADEQAGERQLPRSTLAAIDRLEVAVAALDQASRSQAHTISIMSTKYVEIQNRVNDQANRLSETMDKIKTTDSHLLEACGNIIDRSQAKSTHKDDMQLINVQMGTLRTALLLQLYWWTPRHAHNSPNNGPKPLTSRPQRVPMPSQTRGKHIKMAPLDPQRPRTIPVAQDHSDPMQMTRRVCKPTPRLSPRYPLDGPKTQIQYSRPNHKIKHPSNRSPRTTAPHFSEPHLVEAKCSTWEIRRQWRASQNQCEKLEVRQLIL